MPNSKTKILFPFMLLVSMVIGTNISACLTDNDNGIFSTTSIIEKAVDTEQSMSATHLHRKTVRVGILSSLEQNKSTHDCSCSDYCQCISCLGTACYTTTIIPAQITNFNNIPLPDVIISQAIKFFISLPQVPLEHRPK